jgi:hypothetical protein
MTSTSATIAASSGLRPAFSSASAQNLRNFSTGKRFDMLRFSSLTYAIC